MATQPTNKTPDDLPAGLGKPATRALATMGITLLSQLSQHRESEILALHGMGAKGIRILKAALAEQGKDFAG